MELHFNVELSFVKCVNYLKKKKYSKSQSLFANWIKHFVNPDSWFECQFQQLKLIIRKVWKRFFIYSELVLEHWNLIFERVSLLSFSNIFTIPIRFLVFVDPVPWERVNRATCAPFKDWLTSTVSKLTDVRHNAFLPMVNKAELKAYAVNFLSGES